MESLFVYNWQVRDEWFKVCGELSEQQLRQERIGGVGSILNTFFHIVDVESSWIREIEGLEDLEPSLEAHMTLDDVKALSDQYRVTLKEILLQSTAKNEDRIVKVSWQEESYSYGEVLRHVIAHEIHHIGQLSVWAKEIGIERVSANFIGRGLSC
ncbi:DinB family protein [Paenibacillus pini]|uniref:Damage-inducible protein DinB n=1 Tax=Paenibacillus pini JCM 16418 TaxID=1236976 RepID=W7Y9Z6_9BACL|nr:DinB family protein [Paenibacillus pini]GAF07865.1 hypothetical protein JCM16418_1897 [Paenibacillus pini JCM 16418]